MLRFVDIFAKVYPFSSTLLDSLDFFDSLSLSQTCRLLRDQTLENPLAFTNIDLRDKRAVGAIERYIERDRTRIQHASYLNGAAMHSILFETVNAHFSPYTPPKLFYDLSYAFEIQRLITIRVKVLKLDGLFINLPAMLSILKGIEPTIETLSMVSVRGVQLADFLELFTMDSLRWVKLKELKIWRLQGNINISELLQEMFVAKTEKMNLRMDIKLVEGVPVFNENQNCGICTKLCSFTLMDSPSICEVCGSFYCEDCVRERLPEYTVGSSLRNGTQICTLCDEADIPHCACGSGWLFVRSPGIPRSNLKLGIQKRMDAGTCYVCNQWKCEDCNFGTFLKCCNCWNIVCESCVEPPNSEHFLYCPDPFSEEEDMVCPVCLQGYLCNECLQDPDVDIEFSQPGFSRICPMCQRPDLGWSDESMRTALRKHSAPDFTDDEDKSEDEYDDDSYSDENSSDESSDEDDSDSDEEF